MVVFTKQPGRVSLMPWRKQTKAGSWKPVRVQHAWLDKLRAACKESKRHTLPFDPDTVSDPKLLEFACDIAAWVTSDEFHKQLKPSMDKVVLDAATRVAAHFGAKIVLLEDGALSVTEPGIDHEVTVPAVPFEPPKPPRMVH